MHISEKNKVQLQQIATNPPQAVLLYGDMGVGKSNIAKLLARKLLSKNESYDIGTHPYFYYVSQEGSTISIDAIREIKQKLILKTPGESTINRIVLIDHAHALNVESQNALLKILEEPPKDTVIILTSDNSAVLLPTILSRLSAYEIYHSSIPELTEYLISRGHDRATVARAVLTSDGRAELAEAIVLNISDHPLISSIERAKSILSMSKHERLIQINQLKDKQEIIHLVDALVLISKVSLNNAIAQDNAVKIKQWLMLYKSSVKAKKHLSSNPQSKLLLSDLFLTI